MTTQLFIEKAIEGGWKPFYARDSEWEPSYQKAYYISKYHVHSTLLDHEAWKAVGKVEGWGEQGSIEQVIGENPSWRDAMHRMIDALAEGKTIEQYLETL
jgi:hypothetical protein